MLKDSIISQTAMDSPLGANSIIAPSAGGKKKQLMATVLLTSLVDAFSILVIYLLVVSSNTGEILYLSKDMKLPEAKKVDVLKRATIVKIEEGRFFVENKEVSQNALTQVLLDLRKALPDSDDDPAITIQADRKSPYSLLNQVIHAGGQVGFSEIKFAVLAK